MLGMKYEVLTLSVDNGQNLNWRAGAAIEACLCMRSHAGGAFSVGFGAVLSRSTKKKVSSRRSIEAEFIAVDNKIIY